MVFNVTFNNISVKLGQSVLLVEETEVTGENHYYQCIHSGLVTIHVNILSMYTQWPCHYDYPRKYTINVYTVALSLFIH